MMQKWLINNFWLKLTSLILAIIAWLYISGELSKKETHYYYPRPPVISKP